VTEPTRLHELGLYASHTAWPHALAHRFSLETRFLCALFERHLPVVRTVGVWKVYGMCIPERPTREIKNALGTIAIELEYDVRAHFEEPPTTRAVRALELIHDAALQAARHCGWPPEPFGRTREACVASDYRNEYALQANASPDRRHRAHLWCDHGPDRFQAWLVVADRSGQEVRRQLVVDDQPDEHVFVGQLGKLRWRSSTTVAFVRTDREDIVLEL
jgi:hypothetical protein